VNSIAKDDAEITAKEQAMIEFSKVELATDIPPKLSIWISYPVALCPSIMDDQGMEKPSTQFAGDPVLVTLGDAIWRAQAGVTFARSLG